ncbi:macrolide export ATP-binding/permease protein MacB [mine drainage metagenome]|uniref:Macrolide export ATP-binding/permease protein MacB n=1 Tax=mine drainage metagenome TaxID=410659 RepID=A0A1J5RXI9_9ZZZZ
MIKNYFKIAFRNLWKNKSYSAINIFGLAIGLATCLLITLFITDELSYDTFHTNADRIYRINADIRFGGSEMRISETSDMMGQVLKKDYPQVEEYTRIYNNSGSKLIKKGNEFINEEHVAYFDSTFFNVFTFPAVEGDTKTALNEPNTVVVTESAAKKYFNTTNVLGKTVEVKKGETTQPFKITAVIKDMPHNSDIRFDFMFSMKSADYQWGQFTSHNFHTYLLLKKGTDYKAFEKNFPQYIEKYVLPYVQQFIKINSMDEFKKAGNRLDYSLIPLTKIHLYSDYSFELSPSGNIQYVYIFGAVAIFILIIACINFMNLSTARSANRAKEVGIRKVLGTERKTLVTQFLVESTITAFISLFIAIVIAYLVLPLFNNVAAKSLSINDLLSFKILPFIILLPFIVGLLAGSYPALFLSGFKPIVVLKGNANSGFKKSNLRNVLVVFQFTTSVILIIGTIIIYNQLHYIQTKKLGYNKDQVLIINGTGALNNNIKAFKNEVLAMQGVSSATISSFLPVSSSSRNDNSYSKEAVMDSKSGLDLQTWTVDYDYIKTLGMEIVKGRNFSREFGTDTSAVLITETTAKILGYADPIGKMIYAPSNINAPGGALLPLQIIGVIKDFHFESLHQNIGPLCMRLGNSNDLVSFKITAANTQNLIPQVEKKWKEMASGMPFSYRFLDDAFNEMYISEKRVGTIAIVFAILAVFVACLGLFGLVTFMAEQRTKEIGVRKVLGASVSNLVAMLSKDFLKLVIISTIIAFPVAWWGMRNWLQNFAYRIDISWWIFLAAAVIALAVALITISFQAIKAANANPVKSLRTE